MSEPILRATSDTGLKGAVDRGLAWACVGLMGLSVLNVTWQVLTRFALGDPSGFTDELARFLLIWLGMLGAAYAVGQRMHLAIDLLPRALDARPTARAALGLVLQGCVLLFAAGAMVYGGGNLVRLTTLLGQTSAALGVSLGAVYSVLPIAGVMISLYALLAMGAYVQVLRGRPLPGPAPDGASDQTFAAHSPGGGPGPNQGAP